MDTDVDLHSLRIVRAIADHGTISAAARALGYSQPALSQHLRRVGERIGAPLVVRSGRGVRLTELGQVLARHALTISSALDAAGGELAELVGLRTGTVRLAAFPTASSTILPALLLRMREQHPGIRVAYQELEPPEALGLLRDGLIDVAVTFAYPGDRADPHRAGSMSTETVPLFDEPVVLVLPAGHPLAGGDPADDRPAGDDDPAGGDSAGAVDLAALADENWIAGCALCRGHLLAACDAVGVEPRIDLETDNAVAVLTLVAAGVGIALLPRIALATAPVPAGAVVRATRPSSDRSIQAVVQAGSRGVPSIAAVLARLRDVDGSGWRLTRA